MSATPPDRLAAGLEASALLRRSEQLGGFGTVLHRGDSERGTLVLLISERGLHAGVLERRLRADGSYGWSRTGPAAGDSAGAAQHVARIRRSDPDCWALELDIPSAERFIAETTAEG